MKTILTGVLLAVSFIFPFSSMVQAESAPLPEDSPNASLPLCLPGIYLNQPGDCLPLGPSETLSSLAKIGFTFPPKSPVGFSPSADLATIPYRYIKVTADQAPIPLFRTPPEKRDDPAPLYQDPGFKYFSYSERGRK